MEPFTFLIGLALTSYVIGGVATDFVAVAKRQEPPSLTKSRERHARKIARGEESNSAPSYLGRIVGNAAERWATKSDQNHRDRLQWIEEQAPKRSTEWLQRKRDRAARYERAAQAFANQRGVLWGKTRDAAEALRERRDENEAWRRNATVDPAPDPDPASSDNPYRVYSADGRSWHRPVHYDDDGVGWALHPDGTWSRVEDHLEQEEAIADGRVGPDATILEFRRPGTGPTEGPVDDDSLTADELARLTEHQVEMVRSWRRSYAGQHVSFPPEDWFSLPPDLRGRLLDEALRTGADARFYPNGHRVAAAEVDTEAAQHMQEHPARQGAALESEFPTAGTEQSMTEQTPSTTAPTTDTAEPSYETAGLTATLARTQASADQCTALVAEWDQRHAMLAQESTSLTQQIAGIETQIASLQQAGNAGEEIEHLRTAQEQYTAAQLLIDQQANTASGVLEAYQSAAAAFGQAHAGFQQQVAGQEFYAAHGGAGNKEFLTQG